MEWVLFGYIGVVVFVCWLMFGPAWKPVEHERRKLDVWG